MAVQSSWSVSTVHQDPVTKSQRITNSSGSVISTVDVDPWGGETGRSSNQAFQPHRYTSYERDANGGDDAMMRRYQSSASRFNQPDPYDGSYNLTDPQSLNRYAYTQNDPVSFVDPSGLLIASPRCTMVSFWRPHIEGGGEWITRQECGNEFYGDGGGGGYGSGFRGRTPQNTTPTPPTGDCARFADRVAQIASGHNDVRGFVNELARTFIGVASSSVYDMRPEVANNTTGESFSSTGFRADLFDNVSDNQARHFMGGLIAGYNLASVTLATAVMNHNEDSQADRRVNEISIPLGARLTNPRRAEIVNRGDRGKWRRITATPGFKALADAIRNQVCAR